MRVALAQLDLTVGDITSNTARVVSAIDEARAAGAQILALPELAITGYPPEDLLLRRSFVTAAEEAVNEVAEAAGELVVVVGNVDAETSGSDRRLYNAAIVCTRGEIVARYRKQLLPNYGVFDEARYFVPGDHHYLFDTAEGVLGVCVCEDAWKPDGPLVSQADAGAEVIVNINASPFHRNKLAQREEMLCERARRARSAIVYVNSVGGQDELVFDGGSIVVDPSGTVVARAPQFVEHFSVVDVPRGERRGTASGRVTHIPLELPAATGEPSSSLAPRMEPTQEVYEALKISLSDYAAKNGFERAVIGLSGGIDSSLTAAIAADALGPDKVLGISMPSAFSSEHSVGDADKLARNLGISYKIIPIGDVYDSFIATLEAAFGEHPFGLAEENLQARARGNILMAVSNRYGHLVLATGNKSELAVGYATLYGDMAGGFALLKDVFKTEVYELSRWRNTVSAVIPESVLDKPPSAELRPDQKDSDSLPPYDLLDEILEAYVEDDASRSDILARDFDAGVVDRVIKMVDRTEYKRRQAPPGPKVTTKAFGRDRRLPISNRWQEGR